MRISDWSSDVCSSDLWGDGNESSGARVKRRRRGGARPHWPRGQELAAEPLLQKPTHLTASAPCGSGFCRELFRDPPSKLSPHAPPATRGWCRVLPSARGWRRKVGRGSGRERVCEYV